VTETLLERAKRCFKLAVDTEAKQRERERADLRFQVPEMQWDEAARKARDGDNGLTPPRPILSIPKIDQPIQLVENQARTAMLGVNVHPISEDANDDTAEVIQGIYRRIERDSNAQQARLWAFDRAVKAGRGAYRVTTKYDEDADPRTFDQEIAIERILHQDMVYFDPAAQKPDYSDGKWAFVAAWVSRADFERLYPKSSIAGMDDGEFRSIAASEPEWVAEDRGVLVTEYWYKDTVTEEITSADGKRTRQRETVKVYVAKLCGSEVLEEPEEWSGKYIPLIPVLGRELQPIDSERIFVGMIGPSKDGQRLYNFAASTLVERMAMEPKTPWLMPEGQDEGYENEWALSNVKNQPVLHYKLKTLDGKDIGPPQRAQLDQTGMSMAMMALQEADQFVQAATAIYDPSLGRQNPRDKSGRAILALQSQSDAGTSHYLASLADVSLTYEARMILDLMPHVYDRPGRVMRILGAENDERAVMVNAPFTMDQNKRPVPAPGMKDAKVYDLRKGAYSVSVSIGKSFQTRLEQGQTEIGEILAAQPTLMPLLGATYFRFRDFPGAKEIADVLKKVRDKEIPGLDEGEDGKPSADQLAAQVQNLGMQAQALQAQLQQAMAMIETDRAKQEAAIRIAELKAQVDLQKAQADNATKLQVAQIGAGVKAGSQAEDVKAEQTVLAEDHAFEFNQAEKDRAHETQMQREKMAHDVAMAAAGGRTMTTRREGGTSEDSEQGRESTSGNSAASAPPQPKGGEA
jgi:hypothetical protein